MLKIIDNRSKFDFRTKFKQGLQPLDTGHNIHTPYELCLKILDKIKPNKNHNFGIFYNFEFVILLIENYSINPKNITLFGDSDEKEKIANKLGINYNSIDKLFDKNSFIMKFDVIIGNPPYNKGLLKYESKYLERTGGYPHLGFVNLSKSLINPNGIISMLMPASFMTLISCDFWRIENSNLISEIQLLDNRKNDVFPIEHTWIANLIISDKEKKTKYIIEDKMFDVDLNKYTYQDNGKKYTTWPMFTSKISKDIFEKIKIKSKPLLRDSETTLKKNYHYIGYILQGVNDRPVVNDTPKEKKSNGTTDIHSPGYILFETKKDAENYCKFMEGKLYKFLINITKCISKTQPTSIQQIGNFDFSNIDTSKDNDIYKFFNLTKEEIDVIEGNN
jgi:hypothetical protein